MWSLAIVCVKISLCRILNMKRVEGEEGKVKRETDEEEMMIMCFGNNKNNKDDEKW